MQTRITPNTDSFYAVNSFCERAYKAKAVIWIIKVLKYSSLIEPGIYVEIKQQRQILILERLNIVKRDDNAQDFTYGTYETLCPI